MNTEQCSICLEKCSTGSIEDSDEYNVKWFTKLQFIVPELEWLEEYLICEYCKKQLEQAWAFKKLVLNLEAERRLRLTKKEIEENSDFKDSCDNEYHYDEENEFGCDVCSKIFTTQTQLHRHKLQIHCQVEAPQHEQTHTESKDTNNSVLFTCFDCGGGFKTKIELLFHIENEYRQSKLCLICEKLYLNEVLLQNHMRDKHKVEICRNLACSLCSQTFELETEVNEHIKLCSSKLRCDICKQVFNTRKQLNAHAKKCKKQQGSYKPTPHQCTTCKNFYTTKRNLNLHKIWCTKEKEQEINHKETIKFSCDICVIKFDSIVEYNSHNVSKHDSQRTTESQPKTRTRKSGKPLKIFSCENCSKQFNYAKLVVEHCVSVHGIEEKVVKPYSCGKCMMRFASSANLDQHCNYHEKNRIHICSLCGKGFITKSDLTVHEYTHYNRRNYKCSQCDKAFNTNKNLRTHNLVVHTDRSLWKYGCSVCEKRFPLKTNYEEHLRRHKGEKKYICHICRKPFISKSEMQRHINLHSNIKAFKCSQCDKEYKDRRTYLAHLTKKHGIGNAKVPVREKKFVCHICPSQFYDKQKLSRHLCSHTGLKPFPCHVCDKRFTDKSYLKRHLKITHNVIEPLKMDSME